MSSIRPRRRAGQRPVADDQTDPPTCRVRAKSESEMKLGPRPAGRPWTPAEDAQLLALFALENRQTFDRPEIKTDRVSNSQATGHLEQTPARRAGAEGQ